MPNLLNYLWGPWISYVCPVVLAILALFGDRVLHQTEPDDSTRWWKHRYSKYTFVALVAFLTIVSIVFQSKKDKQADALATDMQNKLTTANEKIQGLQDDTIQRSNAAVSIQLWREATELGLDMQYTFLTPERGLLEGATTLIENVGDMSQVGSADRRVPPEMLYWIDNYYDAADAYCRKLGLTIEGGRLLLSEAGVESPAEVVSGMTQMAAQVQAQLKKMRSEAKSSRFVIPRSMRGQTQMLLSSAQLWHDVLLMFIQLEHAKRLHQTLPPDSRFGKRESQWARSVMNLTTRPAEVINATIVNPSPIRNLAVPQRRDQR